MRQEVIADIQQSIEQSYNQLEGDWLQFLEVARKYERKVPRQDRLDIRHDIMIELHRARQRDGKALPQLRAYRIASLTVALYWRKAKRIPTMLSLNTELEDDEGNVTELMDTIADDHAIDLSAWLDARMWLQGCKLRLVKIAVRLKDGLPLTDKDWSYLKRFRRKEQKPLF